MKLMRSNTFVVAVAVLALVVAGLTALSGIGVSSGQAGSAGLALPDLHLAIGGIARGDAALDALGADLETVARAYGLSTDELQSLLRRDSSLAIDPAGRLLYTCAAAPSDVVSGLQTAAGSALYPLGDTFALHSRQGARRVIYLDFDGGVLTGTAWNQSAGVASINCPPYDSDGNPAFSPAELAAIQLMWARVAEDYAPFDVDVTTQAPAADRITRSTSTDAYYGTRVLVSDIHSYFGLYGGIAYVGIFNTVDTRDFYKPALVFPGPQTIGYDDKIVAEAISHEAGHNLGLNHDGLSGVSEYYVGHGPQVPDLTGWAPIMGASYYRNVTQWSRGEYPNATNTEDDLARMTSYGIALRADDHGGTLSSATVLSGSPLLGSGVITSRTDVDVFRFFSGVATLTVTVQPLLLTPEVAGQGPNLNAKVELLSPSGAVLAAGSPADSLSASLTAEIASAGNYYVRVDGAGETTPAPGYSDYGSVGSYTVTVSTGPPASNNPPVAVATMVPPSGVVAGQPVTFDGSLSSDPDGDTLTYSWAFGDGSSATGVTTTHAYSDPGVYTATLTVTDQYLATASATVTVEVAPPSNYAPIAAAVATPASGIVPLTVTLSAAGSTDRDGDALTYLWDFGDGEGGLGQVVTHVYDSPGTYTATVTVTDDDAATSSASVTVRVATAKPVMRVDSIGFTSSRVSTSTKVVASVKVTDALGQPVPAVMVTARWSGATSGTVSARTAANGVATFARTLRASSATVTISVSRLYKSGIAYDSALNLVTSATFTY